MNTKHIGKTGFSRIAGYLAVVVIGLLVSVAFAPPHPKPKPKPKPKPAWKYKKAAKRRIISKKRIIKPVPRVKAVPIVYGTSGGGTTVVVTGDESSDSTETAPPAETTVQPTVRTPEPRPEEESDIFEGCTAYEVLRMEDAGMTLVLAVDGQETPVRMIGLSPVLPPKGMKTGRHEGKHHGSKRPENASQSDKPQGHPIAMKAILNMVKGESVYVVYDETVAEQDEDGKYIAYLYRSPDGLNINEELIRQGFALADDNYSFEKSASFKLYQTRAQMLKKGLWALISGKKPSGGESRHRPPGRSGRPEGAN